MLALFYAPKTQIKIILTSFFTLWNHREAFLKQKVQVLNPEACFYRSSLSNILLDWQLTLWPNSWMVIAALLRPHANCSMASVPKCCKSSSAREGPRGCWSVVGQTPTGSGPVVNFTNILKAAFAPVILSSNNYKAKL
jgi:hypothetical protein